METLDEPTTGLSPTPTCEDISEAQTLVITIDDKQPDKNYSVDCCHPGPAASVNVDPLRVPASEKCIQFVLRPDNWKFIGFLSPQDPKHNDFEVQEIDAAGTYQPPKGPKEFGLSRMVVEDKHNAKSTYRYELVFYDNNNKKKAWHLYNFDPQIKNT